jgi:hypothetical protein
MYNRMYLLSINHVQLYIYIYIYINLLFSLALQHSVGYGLLVPRGFVITNDARRRDLYLTAHNKQTSMPPVGLEPMIAVGERP